MLEDDVHHLLRDWGSSLTLTRPADATYDPAAGQMSSAQGASDSSFSILGVFINYMDMNVDGSTIRAGDRRLLVSAKGSATDPRIGDVVGGMRILDVRSIAPNGTPVAFACQTRK